MGGHWTYDGGTPFQASAVDREFIDEMFSGTGDWIMGGHWTYDGGTPFQASAVDREFIDEMFSGTGDTWTCCCLAPCARPGPPTGTR